MLALRRREFVDALGVDFQIRFVRSSVCLCLRCTRCSVLTPSARQVTVRDVAKSRDYSLPEGAAFSADPMAAATSSEVDVVVECMGGTSEAKDAVLAALARGKHVATANKALLSAHLCRVADAAREGGAQLGFEAAVCGGIPIVKAMQRDVVADQVEAVSGILNGTTNYVLTRMEAEGVGYADAVADAQRLGYAEGASPQRLRRRPRPHCARESAFHSGPLRRRGRPRRALQGAPPRRARLWPGAGGGGRCDAGNS